MPDRARESDAEAGFLDVAANALAVIIMATMMLVVVSAPILAVGEIRPRADPPELVFPERPRPSMRPLFSFHFVTPEGLVDIDLDALAEAGATAQGQLAVQTPRTPRRDWNEYAAQFRPAHAVLRATATALDPESLAGRIEHLAQRYQDENVAPTLFATPDATEFAAPLYWGLRARGVLVRFRVVDYGTNVPLERRPAMFESSRGGD